MRAKIFSILTLCTSSQLFAQETSKLRLLLPTEATIDIYQNKTVHDPYLYPIDQQLGTGGKFNLNLDLIRYSKYKIYWENTLHFDQSKQDQHIKHAGWWYFLGATLIPKSNNVGGVDLFMEHHSRHILEETRDTHFPVYDRYGVRLILLKK